jgi:hypothetical protein
LAVTLPLSFFLLLSLGVVLTTARSDEPQKGACDDAVVTRKVFCVAAKEQSEMSGTEKKGIADPPTASEATTGTQNKKVKPSGQKASPLKPFVPSKEIEADQAVDFPHDI